MADAGDQAQTAILGLIVLTESHGVVVTTRPTASHDGYRACWDEVGLNQQRLAIANGDL